MRIGLLGSGNIGSFLLDSINQKKNMKNGKIVSIYSRNKEKTQKVASEYRIQSYESIESFLKSDLDLVIEATTVQFARSIIMDVLDEKIDLVLSSIGALGDKDILENVEQKCNANSVEVHIPSGAIGGLDLMQSAKALGELSEVCITTRKPPQALSLDKLVDEPLELFNGKANEAIKEYPKNINVAIALSLAGIGSEKTTVKIIADPRVKNNVHTITATGSFGNVELKVQNESMPANPKTSYLAALSVLSSVQKIENKFKIG